jgi:hypothetical protein
MPAVPPAIPVTMPEDAPIVATVVPPLVHVPPDVASLNVIVLPWQTVPTPVIGNTVVTVNVAAATQPAVVV